MSNVDSSREIYAAFTHIRREAERAALELEDHFQSDITAEGYATQSQELRRRSAQLNIDANRVWFELMRQQYLEQTRRLDELIRSVKELKK